AAICALGGKTPNAPAKAEYNKRFCVYCTIIIASSQCRLKLKYLFAGAMQGRRIIYPAAIMAAR
ncbi:hypothetical protein, partial [Hydrogenoanaerobacterium sp.]|uniref:hypothetical protein n=1 Tax=Hydrogenoanaerobacterium sp. TaxID=2953763 RepID=UPI0028A0E8E6